MFTPFCSTDLNSVTLKDKRILLSTLKDAIKNDVLLAKGAKIAVKFNKEAEKRSKVLTAIRIAEEKLAKLNAKLA